MNKRERVRYEMLLRVRDFGNGHPELLPESSSGHQALATVKRAIDEIEALMTARAIAASETRKDQVARRAVILDRLRTIARTSRRVVLPTGRPLRLHWPEQGSDAAIAEAARRFLTLTDEHHDQFVKLNLPDNCLSSLREALEAFEGALSGRRIGRRGVAEATKGIKVAIASGSDAARTLDLVVRNGIVDNEALLAGWERDLRLVTGIGKRGSKAQAEPAAPATGVPASEPPSIAPVAVQESEVVPIRQAS